jgi:hypothetical protein
LSDDHRIDHLQIESEAPSDFAQLIHAGVAPGPHPRLAADDQDRHPETVAQFSKEVVGGPSGKLLIERDYFHMIRAGVGEQIEAIFPGIEKRDPGSRPQDSERVRPEGHNQAAAIQMVGGGAGGLDQRPVAEVDSV